MTTAARGGSDPVVLYVYDITKGDNLVDAMKIFDAKAEKPEIYKYSLQGPANAAPSTQTGWFVIKNAEGKDDKLTLFSASADAGFVIIEFPKKTLDD